MPVPARISLVTLGVSDLARATAFYESLGWRPSGASGPTVTFFNTDGPVLSLFGMVDLAHDAGLAAGGDDHAGAGGVPTDRAGRAADAVRFRGASLAINMESPARVDEVFAEWLRAGAAGLTPPHETDWGGYSGYVADLDGHLWELAYNPGFSTAVVEVVRAPA